MVSSNFFLWQGFELNPDDSTCHLEFRFYGTLFFFCFIYSDYLFKLLLIGDSGVGKSCLLLRFAVGIFVFSCSFDEYCLICWLDFDRG